METFSFNPPMSLSEQGKWLLAITFFEATNSVFNITGENKSFSIGTPGYWRIPNYLPDGNIDKLKELLERRSQKNNELHVTEVGKRSNRKKMKNRS